MSDFWLGIFLGYVIGQIVAFIVEMLCIASGNSEINKWMEEGDKNDNK